MSKPTRALRPYLATLLCMLVAGCGDSDSTADAPTSDSTGATTTTTTAGADTTTTTDPATTGTSGTTSTTTAADTSGSSTAAVDTGTSDGSTGPEPFGVPFSLLDPVAVPLPTRVVPGWLVITSAAEWDAQTGGAPLPPGVSVPEQWLVFGSRGPQPFPGHRLEVSALTWDSGMLVVEGDAVDPDADCETFQFTWPADTLLAIDALEVAVSGFDDQTLPLASNCAAGAGDSASCDLLTPCATGLVCAGLIRSTVISNNPGGLCLPIGYSGVFTGGPLAIPANGSVAETSQLVSGLTTVDMDVVIWVELDHPAPQELIIELRNPDGNQVMVANLQDAPLHPGGVGIVPVGFSGDESVNGSWSLVVRDDVVNGNNGSVLSWELEIMSRFD